MRPAPALGGAILALALAVPVAAANQVADPFYSDLLRSGTQALERGDANRAAEELRLACFGMLEQPPQLAVCLVRLSIAQAKLGEQEEFLATFRRLEEIESRFGSYRGAELTPAERAGFEAQALDWVAPEILRSLPGFAPALREREIAAVRALPANRRLPEIQKRLAAEPDELLWKVMAAELDLDDGKPERAAAYLQGVEPAADSGRIACLRGRARAEAGRCAPAVADLALCAQRGKSEALLAPDLACLIELELWSQARALLASADPSLRDRGAIRRLARKIPDEPKVEPPPTQAVAVVEGEGELAADSASAAPVEDPEPAGASSVQDRTEPAKSARPSDQGLSDELGAADQRKIARARRELRAARTAAELDGAFALAQELARAHPERPEIQLLVGEIHYRASRWPQCAAAYGAGGPAGPEDPTQRFYMAVCLYEAGERARAAQVSATGLDRLPRTPFVQAYLDRFAAARR